MSPKATVDRREFARSLTAGAIGVLPLAAGSVALAAGDDEPNSAKPPAPADLILELVQRQYPEKLEGEQLALIRKDIEGFLSRSRVLSSFPLVNADEPAFTFAAFRKDEG